MTLNFRDGMLLTPRNAAMIATLLLASACAKTNEPQEDPETVVELNLVGVENLNPNLAGEPSPIILVLYELADAVEFQDADFNQLFYEGGILPIDRQEFRIMPGDTVQTRRTLDPATRFLGFVAGYREIEGKRWRAISEPSPDIPEAHFVVIGSESLSVSEAMAAEFDKVANSQGDEGSEGSGFLAKIWPF